MPGIDSNTLLLIHSNTTDGSTTFTDSGGATGCPHTIAVSYVEHSTDKAKFGSSSIQGSLGLLSISDSAIKSCINSGWSCDFWVWLENGASIDVDAMRLQTAGNNQDVRLSIASVTGYPSNYTFKTYAYIHNPDFQILWNHSIEVASLSTGWHHVELTRNGTTLYLFVNGTLAQSWGSTGTVPESADFDLNLAPNDAYYDEIRFSTTARHTANFTPPTAPYDDTVGVEISALPLSATGRLSANFPIGITSPNESDDLLYTPKTLEESLVLADGDTGFQSGITWWIPGPNARPSFGLDQQTVRPVYQLRVYGSTFFSYSTSRPTHWSADTTFKLFKSDDNYNWTLVESFLNPTINYLADFYFYFDLAPTTPPQARYLKVVCDDIPYPVDDSEFEYQFIATELVIDNEQPPVVVSPVPFSATATLGGYLYEPVLIASDVFEMTHTLSCLVSMQESYFTHAHTFTAPRITVTQDVPEGVLALTDEIDTLAIYGETTLGLTDEVDALSFSAVSGAAGALSLFDLPDIVAAGAGGDLALFDDLDVLAITAQTAVVGEIALADGIDSLQIDGAPGHAGTLSLLDQGDSLSLGGHGEIQAIMALYESPDHLQLSAASGTAAVLVLVDIFDDLEASGYQELRAALPMLDPLEVLDFAGTLPGRFDGDVIQYVEDRG